MPWELLISLHCQVPAAGPHSHYWALIKNWKENILSALPAGTVRSQQFANSKLTPEWNGAARSSSSGAYCPPGLFKALSEAGAKVGNHTRQVTDGETEGGPLAHTHARTVTAGRPAGPCRREPGRARSCRQRGREEAGGGAEGGADQTHHSAGSAGWLALAGRSGGRARADAKKEKSVSCGPESRPPPRHRPRPRPVPPQTARKQTYFLPPAGPPAPPAAPGPRHSRRGLL